MANLTFAAGITYRQCLLMAGNGYMRYPLPSSPS